MNEEIEAIIAELRLFGTTPPPRGAWEDLADRLEAAWAREVVVSKSETTTDIEEMITDLRESEAR